MRSKWLGRPNHLRVEENFKPGRQDFGSPFNMVPLVIAHRGASGEAPENTMKAFQLALDQGADGIELDVFLSKDGHLVVTHDEELSRLTHTRLETRKTDLATLKMLDFGEGEKIPTLVEVFEAFGQKSGLFNIEIKSTGYLTDGVEKKVVALIQKFGLQEKVVVSSFNPLHLFRMRRFCPSIKRGFLITPDHWMARRPFFIRACDVSTLNIDSSWLKDDRLATFRKMGKQIWVWTVNRQFEMEWWIEKGVDAIITNHPGKLKALLTSGSG